MIGFIIWTITGCLFIGIGISTFFAKKARGFWANDEIFEVTDVKAYNCSIGILWCIFGVVFILLGIPILNGQNSPFILISIIGVMIEAIAFMVFYTLVIEKKYRKE